MWRWSSGRDTAGRGHFVHHAHVTGTRIHFAVSVLLDSLRPSSLHVHQKQASTRFDRCAASVENAGLAGFERLSRRKLDLGSALYAPPTAPNRHASAPRTPRFPGMHVRLPTGEIPRLHIPHAPQVAYSPWFILDEQGSSMLSGRGSIANWPPCACCVRTPGFFPRTILLRVRRVSPTPRSTKYARHCADDQLWSLRAEGC